MKPIWMLTALSALFLACGGDDDAAADDNGSADSGGQDAYGQNPYGGQQGGPGSGQGGPGMGPGGGQGMGPGGPGGDPSAQGGGGDPYGSGGPGGQFGNGGQPGGPPKPTFDASLPEGKKQVWTKSKITTQWTGKSAADLLKSFGQPASWKQAQGYTAYIYDKMYVTEKNKKFSKITFAVQPDKQSPGGGKIIAIGLVPSSGTPLRPNGGGQGFPGQDGGFPPGGGGPPQGYPGQGGGPPGGFNQGGGGPPQGYPSGGQGQGRPPQGFQPQPRN